MADTELVDKVVEQFRYQRKVLNNDGTMQVSLDKDVSKRFVGLDFSTTAYVDLRYSQKHDVFYWSIYPEGDQPSPDEIKDEILKVVDRDE